MSDFLSNIVEQSIGIAESIRPLIRPLFASVSGVALDSSLLVWDDPQTRLSEIALQPAITVATTNGSMSLANLVARGSPPSTPQPGSLLRRTPQTWQSEPHWTEPASTEELTLLVQPLVEPATLLTTQTQMDGAENEFPTLLDTRRTTMASAAQHWSNQRTVPITNTAPTATPQGMPALQSPSIMPVPTSPPLLASAEIEHGEPIWTPPLFQPSDTSAKPAQALESQVQMQSVPALQSPFVMPVPTSPSLLADAESKRDETSYVLSMDMHKDSAMQRTTLPVQREPAAGASSNIEALTRYQDAAGGQPVTMDVNQNQQVNTWGTLAETMLTTPIMSKSFSEPVPDFPLKTVSRALDAVIQQQIASHRSAAAVAPMLQPVEQGQALLISSAQNTSLTVKAGFCSDESQSSTLFTEGNQDIQAHLRERAVLAPLASIQPQITTPIEVQHTEVSELEQETSQEEQTLLIRVSIGRVEVRAIPPFAPSPAAKPVPRPALSLNDYLTQRRKGIR